jgi:NAD(P)-dependent dehydrogenase (short-subunit alcohol dehydrogenase family)
MPSNRRVLLLGAETDLGRACAEALAAAGHTLAFVAATTDGDAAFAVKRLATRVGAPVSQAIDATNEAAVRVMVRQVSKALGGLDAVVDTTGASLEHVESLAGRELARHGRGKFVRPETPEEAVSAVAAPLP